MPKFPKIEPVPVEVTVKNWGDRNFHILPLTGTESDELDELEASAKDEDSDLMIADVARGYVGSKLVTQEGEQYFDPEDEDDYREILKLPHDGVMEVYGYIKNPFLRDRARVDGAKGN